MQAIQSVQNETLILSKYHKQLKSKDLHSEYKRVNVVLNRQY